MVSKPWSESRIRDGGVYRPRRGIRCRLASPSRTREARGCSWICLKFFFLFSILDTCMSSLLISSNLYYIFISPIERLKKNQPGAGHLPGCCIPTPFERNANARGLARRGMGTAGID